MAERKKTTKTTEEVVVEANTLLFLQKGNLYEL